MTKRMALDQLRGEAGRVRSYLEASDLRAFNSFPNGCCKSAAVFLLKWLAEGHGVLDGMLIANASRQKQSHAWAMVGRVILDITADQFSDFTEPVFVAVRSPWHDSFHGAQAFAQSEATHLSDPFDEEYQRMVVQFTRPDNKAQQADRAPRGR